MNKKRFFEQGKIFHICNKSIANYGIFKDRRNTLRFVQTLNYYNRIDKKRKLSNYLKLKKGKHANSNLLSLKETNKLKFLAYCIMLDHYHLLIKVLRNNILSKYISDVKNSFSHSFYI